MKPATKHSIRGRIAAGIDGFAHGISMMAHGVAGLGQSYDAGRRDNRRIRSWRPGGGSPNVDLLYDLDDLRERSRDLERNSPLALGAIQSKTNGVIGTGLVLKSAIDLDRLGLDRKAAIAAQGEIEREFELWSKDADFTGQLHWLDLQRLAYRSARVSGDIGIARRYRKTPGKPYGLRLVLIEADRISNPNRQADSLAIRGGVQVDGDGVIQGYWVSQTHPGEIVTTALKWEFVPRIGAQSGLKQMLLPYQLQRPGQPRGVPMFSPIIELIQQLKNYATAEISAAINDAMMFAFETLGADDTDGEPLVTNPDSKGSVAGPDELQLEDLAIITLSNGSGVEVKAPSRPNSGYEPFMLAIIKQIGVALEIPFELMIMHFSSSYSASRAALEIAWKGFLAEKAWFEREVADVVFEWFFVEAVALGRLKADGFLDDPVKRAAWMGRQWIGPTRIQIDPRVEAQADAQDIASRVKSRDQVITERTGGDWQRKVAQIAQEEEDLAGLPGATVATSPKLATAQDQQDDGDKSDKSATDDEQEAEDKGGSDGGTGSDKPQKGSK